MITDAHTNSLKTECLSHHYNFGGDTKQFTYWFIIFIRTTGTIVIT